MWESKGATWDLNDKGKEYVLAATRKDDPALKVGQTPEGTYASRFVQNVRWLIEQNGFTIGQAAGMAGLSERSLYKILSSGSAANPELKTAVGLAGALGVTAEQLLWDPPDLRDRIRENGLRPFVIARPRAGAIINLHSSASSQEANQPAATAQAAGNRRSPRTGWRSPHPSYQHLRNSLRRVA